jgi:hypothetical protein
MPIAHTIHTLCSWYEQCGKEWALASKLEHYGAPRVWRSKTWMRRAWQRVRGGHHAQGVKGSQGKWDSKGQDLWAWLMALVGGNR